ncbi:MAG: outer membrane protein assembly factor BamD [Prevotella sp.]|nr:outer membrane protein assembly factor BamD [Prevotella sp.]
MRLSVLHVLIAVLSVILLSGCAHEFNTVYKSTDYNYKYEFAKECFASGRYSQATALLEDVVTMLKGTDNAEESLYMLAMSEFLDRDYDIAADYFKKYYKTYTRGIYAELASFYTGESLFMSTPEPRLDQSQTYSAIAAFQEYLDLYPEARMKEAAQSRMFELQDKLVKKELYSAQLYFNLGTYFGNCTSGGSNYEACIVTAQNAIKDYPYSDLRENFSFLIMKSKYELAQQSVEEKRLERYRDAEDECYGFLNEFPDSKNRNVAEKYIASCEKITKDEK